MMMMLDGGDGDGHDLSIASDPSVAADDSALEQSPDL